MNGKLIISSLRTELVSGQRTLCGISWANHGKLNFSDPFSRLYWLKSGQGAVIYKDKTITLEPGNLYVFPAYKAARYLCPKEMDLYWIHFKAQLFGCLEIFNLLNWDQQILVPENEDMVANFKLFFDALKSEETKKLFDADALIRRILGFFAKAEKDYRGESFQNLQRFLPAIAFIEQNLHRTISLKELTKVVPLQHTYFCDLFTRTVGQSPIEFINKKRIERAQFLMSKQSSSLKEIAEEVGFKDVYYFSRVFKKIVGVAPAHYRVQEKQRA